MRATERNSEGEAPNRWPIHFDCTLLPFCFQGKPARLGVVSRLISKLPTQMGTKNVFNFSVTTGDDKLNVRGGAAYHRLWLNTQPKGVACVPEGRKSSA